MIPPRPTTVAFAIEGPIAPADVSGLAERVCEVVAQSRAGVARCDVGTASADAVTVDALARLQLVARRNGCQLELCHASSELLELLAFMGLGDVVGG